MVPIFILTVVLTAGMTAACGNTGNNQDITSSAAGNQQTSASAADEQQSSASAQESSASQQKKAEQKKKQEQARKRAEAQKKKELKAAQSAKSTVHWNSGWKYAQYSKIHADSVTLYRASGSGRKGITVAVNAGHGTSNGESVQTQCHPDGSPKLVSGSTAKGSTLAVAVSGGTTLNDGTSEADANLQLARVLKQQLLNAGYDVLMIREDSDTQLDNIARTVFANNNADCHLALHYDSTESNKGFFFLSVPDSGSYRSMEPVASHWRQHNALGEAIVSGERAVGTGIYGSGSMAMDLTQTSYSTIPSVDLEVGDRASDHSTSTLRRIARGIVKGLNDYF